MLMNLAMLHLPLPLPHLSLILFELEASKLLVTLALALVYVRPLIIRIFVNISSLYIIRFLIFGFVNAALLNMPKNQLNFVPFLFPNKFRVQHNLFENQNLYSHGKFFL